MKKYFSVVYTLIILGLIAHLVLKYSEVIVSSSVSYLSLSLAIAIQLVSVLIIPLSWFFLLKAISRGRIGLIKTVVIYSKAWLGRYIPGKVGWIAGRVLYANQIGIGKKVSALTSLIDIALITTIQFILAIPSIIIIIYNKFSIDELRFPLLVFFLIIIPSAYFLIKMTVASHKYKLIMSRSISLQIGITKASLAILTSTILSFIPFLIIMNSTLGLYSVNITYLFSLFYLSNVIGLITVIAPAGLGAKEFILGLGLSHLVPLELVISLLLYHRAILVSSDVIFYLLGLIIDSLPRSKYQTLVRVENYIDSWFN